MGLFGLQTKTSYRMSFASYLSPGLVTYITLGIYDGRELVLGAQEHVQNVLPEAVEEAFGLKLLAVMSGTGRCSGGLRDDNYTRGINIISISATANWPDVTNSH